MNTLSHTSEAVGRACWSAIAWLVNFVLLVAEVAVVLLPLLLSLQMPFNYTFDFVIPGEILNPFSLERPTGESSTSMDSAAGATFSPRRSPMRSLVGPRPRRVPSPIPQCSEPLSRKRGWAPSSAEPTQAIMDQTHTNGYFDTPAKYRDITPSSKEVAEGVHDSSDDVDSPPAKRRKTLAGSIVSTAWSATLIGAAVGLSVYRLWRDRGKEPEPQLQPEQTHMSPPPPYEERDWKPIPSAQETQNPTPSTPSASATTRSRKPRHGSVAARRTIRHRKAPSARSHAQYASTSTCSSSHTSPRSRFDFAHVESATAATEDQDEDQMDWIGDRISQLIEEGKKALGKEVVVMSDAQEDEVDDGTEDWVEEGSMGGPSTASASSSLRRPKGPPRPIHPPPAYFTASLSESDSLSQVGEEEECLSPELRESMQRARELIRGQKQL